VSDDPFVFRPLMQTEALEKILANEERCTKGPCTDRICIWKTPGGHGFTVPNPITVPEVPATTLPDLKRKIRYLDGITGDPQ
jgi:hypothetical protein